MKSLVLISLLLITGCADFYIARDMLRDRGATVAMETLDSGLRVVCLITPHGTIRKYFSGDGEEAAHDAICDIYMKKSEDK